MTTLRYLTIIATYTLFSEHALSFIATALYTICFSCRQLYVGNLQESSSPHFNPLLLIKVFLSRHPALLLSRHGVLF